MTSKPKNVHLCLEIALVITVIGLSCLLFRLASYKIIVLNLFYLPVVLGAFYLGRYRAGVLALLCVISASVVTCLDLPNFATLGSPVVIGLALTIWGGVLGLTALLVGTLSDERSAKMVELHEAHLGVVEVLSRYLQSANPRLKDRSNRVAELSQKVARIIRMSEQEIDNIRVAAILQDMENIEITARVIRKAMDDLDDPAGDIPPQTFHGTDLVRSLGAVLTGAFPLVLLEDDVPASDDERQARISQIADIPFGARIIRTVRAYDSLVHGGWGRSGGSPKEAIEILRNDVDAENHPAIMHGLEIAIISDAPVVVNDRLTEIPSKPSPQEEQTAVAGA